MPKPTVICFNWLVKFVLLLLLSGCSERARSPLAELSASSPIIPEAGRIQQILVDGLAMPDQQAPISIAAGESCELTGQIQIEGESAEGIMNSWKARPGELEQTTTTIQVGQPIRQVMAFLRESGIERENWDIDSIWVEVKPSSQSLATNQNDSRLTSVPAKFDFRYKLTGPLKRGTYLLDICVVELTPPGTIQGKPIRPGPPTERPIYRREVVVN